MSVKKAVVTGARGFVGQYLCRRLRGAGWQVTAVNRPANSIGVENGEQDLWDSEIVYDFESGGELDVPEVDIVYHLAGRAHAVSECSSDATKYININVRGTEAIIRAAQRAAVRRFIYFSSTKVFTMRSGSTTPIREDELPDPDSDYGLSKLAAEKALAAAVGFDSKVILRPALVYGPGVKGNMRQLLQKTLQGRCPPMPEFGDFRSLVHVEDLVEVAVKVACCTGTRTYHITDGRVYSTRKVYEIMMQAAGRRVPDWRIPVTVLRGAAYVGDALNGIRRRRWMFDSRDFAKISKSAYYSNEGARRDLRWDPKFRLEDWVATELACGRRTLGGGANSAQVASK